MWVRAKRGVDFEAATTVPREREPEIEYRLFLFFLLLESALFVSLSGVRGKRRCARALGSSSTSRRRAMMTKTVWELTEIGTISERNNEVALVLSSSFFFLSSFLRRLVVTSSVKRHSSSSLFFVFFRSNKGDDDVEE